MSSSPQNAADDSPRFRYAPAVACLLLALMGFLAGGAALRESVVFDETAHIGAGVSYLQKLDLRLNEEHPPLAKVIAAIPLVLRGTRADYGHISWTNSAQFLPHAFMGEWVFGEWLLMRWNNPQRTLAWARLPMLLFTLVLGWVVFVYARKLGGDWGGLLCLSAYVSTPTFIVFGPLVLTDLAAALFCLLSLWQFADLWREPSRKSVLRFGLCLAGALLSKFSSGLLFFAFAAFALSTRFLALPELPRDKAEQRAWRLRGWRWTRQGTVLAALIVYTVYFLFSFHQSTDALSLIGHSNAWAPLRRLLMPPWLYLRGLLLFAVTFNRATFILGHGYSHGVWFYFPVMLVLKSTLGFLGLLALSLTLAMEQKRHWRGPSAIPPTEALHWRVIWIALVVFTAACMVSRLSISIRHFSVPLVLLILLLAPLPRMIQNLHLRARGWARGAAALAALLAAGSLASVTRAYPNYFPYFNALTWSHPAYWWASDSTMDWNHALPEVRRFADRHGLKVLDLDPYGMNDPTFTVPQAQLWDCQQPTWSRNFREEFRKRRGYDPLPYLPAMARRIVDSRDVTDRFLFDVRWTIGDLMAEQFWIPYGELAHQRGVGIQSETGYGTYPYPHIDGLRCAGNNDLPMGEFWFGTDIMSQFNPWGNVIRTVATAAHVYDRPVVQAESFTAWTHWQEYPESLKPVGDQAFLDGLNRMVFHQYTAQPMLDMKPGWQYGAGTHFDRNLTWWEESRGFFQYLARCQYLLQKGHFDADALYFYGEGVTKFLPSREYLRPALPAGYNFDAIDSELLQHGLAIDHGRWTLPSGMSYRVLVLPEDGVMSAAVLGRIRELTAEGGVVLGPKPQRSPGLLDYPRADAELKKIADEMWGDVDGQRVKERSLGKGKVYSGESLGELFTTERLTPDFALRSGAGGASIDFLHRTEDGAEVYFLSSRRDRDAQAECTFRVAGKRPEFFDPITGESRPAVAFHQAGGLTTVPLEFAPYGSLFVVFRQPMGGNVQGQGSRNFPVYSNAQEIPGPWAVSFDPQWGGPASVEFAKLQSWTERPEEGIKYYSGTATYRKAFDLPPALRGAHAHLALDLGEVKYVAQVRLNGKDLGPLWTKPFRVEITDAVRPSGNVLEIDVANLWPNRIIGDAHLPPEQRYTHTNVVYKPDTPLWESSLLGPVRLELIEDRP